MLVKKKDGIKKSLAEKGTQALDSALFCSFFALFFLFLGGLAGGCGCGCCGGCCCESVTRGESARNARTMTAAVTS